MKKIYLIVLIVIFSLKNSNAQEDFSVGVHLGIPIGNVSDLSKFNYGVDISYLFNVSEDFNVGLTSGFTSFSGDEIVQIAIDDGVHVIQPDNFGFIPIVATARYSFSNKIFSAVDIGYAITTNEIVGDRFYFQPKVGWKNNKLDIFYFYKMIGGISSIGVGIAFKF